MKGQGEPPPRNMRDRIVHDHRWDKFPWHRVTGDTDGGSNFVVVRSRWRTGENKMRLRIPGVCKHKPFIPEPSMTTRWGSLRMPSRLWHSKGRILLINAGVPADPYGQSQTLQKCSQPHSHGQGPDGIYSPESISWQGMVQRHRPDIWWEVLGS
jgi:hypothetical protein